MFGCELAGIDTGAEQGVPCCVSKALSAGAHITMATKTRPGTTDGKDNRIFIPRFYLKCDG